MNPQSARHRRLIIASCDIENLQFAPQILGFSQVRAIFVYDSVLVGGWQPLGTAEKMTGHPKDQDRTKKGWDFPPHLPSSRDG